jgi:hypothetical protein
MAQPKAASPARGDQIGHTDPRFTLRCYTQATGRRERMAPNPTASLRRGSPMGTMGTNEDPAVPTCDIEATKNPV